MAISIAYFTGAKLLLSGVVERAILGISCTHIIIWGSIAFIMNRVVHFECTQDLKRLERILHSMQLIEFEAIQKK